METNEIMENEEVKEAVEKTAEVVAKEVSDSTRLKDFCLGGLAGAISVLAVKYVVIPAVKKIREKRKKNPDVIDADYTEIDTGNDSDEEKSEKK